MIRYAQNSDLDTLTALDKHVSASELENCINLRRVIIDEEDGKLIGWLRFGLFWDNTPFMNMLFIIDGERGKGLGTALCDFWECEMQTQGYDTVLTSTLSNESAQHFYRKRGYKDCGSLILPNEPLEIILMKELDSADFV